jgi:lysozyme
MRTRQAIQIVALATTLTSAVYHANAQDALGAQPRGIDTSHHNADITWKTLAGEGVRFVFIKATDGLDWVDPAFADSFAAADDAGLLRGAYHFYETNDPGEAQADWFLSHVTFAPGDLPPVVDIERIKKPVPGGLVAEFSAFLNRVESAAGVPVIIYTGTNFWDHALKDHFMDRPLWVAEYQVDAPTLPDGWADWTFWQYTDQAAFDASPKPLDASRFNGDATGLQALVIPPTCSGVANVRCAQ